LPDDPIVAVAKVLPRGAVQLPSEVMKRLGLKPGTRLIAMAVEDAVVLRRADMLLRREATKGIVSRLRPMFSQVPVRGIEE
jgi:bifunctional DNA-binding transcriptional regulator/antitoxin component of YhaV-PrlF toxin-antitoxin module